MLVKKLAVPLINEKILLQAEYCQIITAGLSEEGFDFIASRLPIKCKVELVTGLDEVTSPKALWRIWKHFTDRISLRIYTKSPLHANAYIFELPFRKTVAYVGSGNLSFEGLKDQEEVFYKVTDIKEIEALRSWYVGYFEFGEPITEEIINAYDSIYPTLMKRQIASRQEKQEALASASRAFNWDHFKFRNQFFKKDDYLVLSNEKAVSSSPVVQTEREQLRDKMLALHDLIKRDVSLLKLSAIGDVVSSIIPEPENKISEITLSYGRREAEMKKFALHVTAEEFAQIQVAFRQRELSLRLIVGKAGLEGIDRAYFHQQMIVEAFSASFFKDLVALGSGYWIEIAGKRLDLATLKDEKVLLAFTKLDDFRFSTFTIGRNFNPGDTGISTDQIAITLAAEITKLTLIYNHIVRQA
jgi:HKD family nuclease